MFATRLFDSKRDDGLLRKQIEMQFLNKNWLCLKEQQ